MSRGANSGGDAEPDMPIRLALRRLSVSYTPLPMDPPVRPEEELVDAISSLTLTLEKMLDMLEVLACEIVLAGGSFHHHPEDEGPIRS